MEAKAFSISQAASDVLKEGKPVRVAVLLRTRSPLYKEEYTDVIGRTCSAFDIVADETQYRLLAIQKWPRMTILIFDLFHEDYDSSTAHHKQNLPVLQVDHGRTASHMKTTSAEFHDRVNTHVANQHDWHGWDAKPPYFEDQTGVKVPTYPNPRSLRFQEAPLRVADTSRDATTIMKNETPTT